MCRSRLQGRRSARERQASLLPAFIRRRHPEVIMVVPSCLRLLQSGPRIQCLDGGIAQRRTEAIGARVAVDEQHAHLTSLDRKSTRLNSSHANISYAVFCLKKKRTSPSPRSFI